MLHTELIPAKVSESKQLLIALHGLGDSMEGYRWIPRLMDLPKLSVLLVNAPDDYYGGFSWYDYATNPGPGIHRSYGLLASLLDELRAKGFPTGQTVLFGFSQGCLMTIETGLRYPHLFAGLIGVSGYVFEPENLLANASAVAREQKFLITHGSEDPLIPMQKVRAQIDQLKKTGIQMEWVEYEKEHTILEPEIRRIQQFVVERLAGF